jgi:hypothetical protein
MGDPTRCRPAGGGGDEGIRFQRKNKKEMEGEKIRKNKKKKKENKKEIKKREGYYRHFILLSTFHIQEKLFCQMFSLNGFSSSTDSSPPT